MAQLLTKIDELTIENREHWWLGPKHHCYYLREFISRGGYQASETNQLIFNLKIGTDRRNTFQWKWKDIAIRQVIRELREAIGERALRDYTVVPIPPSRVLSDPLYDDRMCQVASGLCTEADRDWRELLVLRQSMVASHSADRRARPEDVIASLMVDDDYAAPPPRAIILLDDVLTTGAHFVGAKTVLEEAFPEIPVVGVFIARAIRIEAIF